MEECMKFEREASRLEVFIIRPLYNFVIGIVLAIYGIIAEICYVIQWFVVLITGERNEGLNNSIKNYLELLLQVYPYMYNLTDVRPELSHKNVKIYVENLEYGNNKEEYMKFEREASRLEVFIIRPLYNIVVFIVLAIYGIIAEICYVIQWFVVLITGERNEGLNNSIKNYVEVVLQVYPYVYNLTDTRPDLGHKDVNIYVERSE